MNFDYFDAELTRRANAKGSRLSTDVFRLPSGEIVYLQRSIDAADWACIVLFSPCDDGSAPSESKHWNYASEFEAEAALAAWEPELSPAPSGC